ncbi:MAG: type I-E CRISPR-associated endoribonuclease Cas2e [Opitutales bacterium]
MIVIIASNTSDKIRGILKRWFIEPKANIFVGTMNHKVSRDIIAYLRSNDSNWNALIIRSGNNVEGYIIEELGEPSYKGIKLSGINLIATKLGDIDLNLNI